MAARGLIKHMVLGVTTLMGLWQGPAYALPEPLIYYSMGQREADPVASIENEGTFTNGTSVATDDMDALAPPNTPIDIFAGDPAQGDFETGTCGYARLNGSSHYLTAGNQNLGLANAVTVMAWVRFYIDPVTGSPAASFISQQDITLNTENSPFILRVDSANPRHLVFGVYKHDANNVVVGKTLVSKTSLNQGRWYHVAGVYDGANLTLYVGGKQDNKVAWTQSGNLLTTGANHYLQMGRWGKNMSRTLVADLDEVRVYKSALTAAEVDTLYKAQDECFHVSESIAPHLQVTSHLSGGTVSESGFVISGTLTDNMEVGGLEITVEDSVGMFTIYKDPVTILYPSGTWAYFIGSSQITRNNTLRVTLEAWDGEVMTDEKVLNLVVKANDRSVQHLTSRISFGLPLWERDRLLGTTYSALVTQQLAPGSIAGTPLESHLATLESQYNTGTRDLPYLLKYELLRAAESPWYLQEVMAWFWMNHFSTWFGKLYLGYSDVPNKDRVIRMIKADLDTYRSLALGNFTTLLKASAMSPAMMTFLDNRVSKAGKINENYAREIMELHTLGVGGGYTETDVAELARVFTGWTTATSNNTTTFYYDSTTHDTDPKTVLGQSLGSGSLVGQAEGTRMLEVMAKHASTATFICTKLAQLFVSDTPSTTTISGCASVFTTQAASSSQMSLVVKNLLNSSEMKATTTRHNKIRTPMEFVLNMVHDAHTLTDVVSLYDTLTPMGYPMFNYPPPTGLAEDGSAWLTTFQQMERQNLANRIMRKSYVGYSATSAYVQMFVDNTELCDDDIVEFISERWYQGDFYPSEEIELYNTIGTVKSDTTNAVFVGNTTAGTVMDVLGTAMSFPTYLYN